MAEYIAKERGQIPADEVRPTKRADASPGRKVKRIVEKGERFTYYGKPGKWMQPVKSGASQADSGGTGKPQGRQPSRTQGGQADSGGSQASKPPESGSGAQRSQ